MSESDAMWAAIERRAISSVTGAGAEDDDILNSAALTEAPMNPHKGANVPSGLGGQGMMPPMMMGGAGAGGQQPGGGTGGLSNTLTSSGGAPTSGQAPAGVSTQGVSAASSLRDAPDPPSGGGGGGGPVGGSSGGASPGPSGGRVSSGFGGATGGGAPEALEDETSPEDPAPQQATTGTAPDAAPRDGFVADPQAVADLANKWNELGERLSGLGINASEARLGLVTAAERPQQAVNDQLVQWLDGAEEQVGAMEERLRQAMQGYEDVDSTAVEDTRRELAQ